MGISIDSKTGEAYIVMNTTPPGNYIGEFAKNVLPLAPGTQTSPTGPAVAQPLAPNYKHIKDIYSNNCIILFMLSIQINLNL